MDWHYRTRRLAMEYISLGGNMKKLWCKCDSWYKAVELEFIRWTEGAILKRIGYYIENEDGMMRIFHCPFCGKKLK